MKNKRNIKTWLCSILLLSIGTPLLAQQDTVMTQDTVKEEHIHTDIIPTIGKKDYDYYGDEIKYPRFFGGLTFARIDWGFSRLIDDGSFTLSEGNEFLDYKKASNFGFDIAQFGVRFNDKFKTYISTGFEWNYLRLKQNVIFDTEATPLDYVTSEVEYKKNIFTSTYLRVPLTFEFRGNKNKHGHRAKIAVGAMSGILLKGTQRLKSKQEGKQKFKDNYNLASFQYGLFARIGFGDLGLFAKYYLNDVFENSPNQQGVNNFTFGATLWL